MKIEIGESLVRSWLRHVEHCEFAELNWKPSPIWDAKPNTDVTALYYEAKTAWPEAFGRGALSQFLKQAEVDVLGLSAASSKLHLVDIAFHSGGLNYGAQGKTGQRIYKKLVRSALIAKTYFPTHDAVIYFVTPFLSPAIKTEVEAACERVKDLFESRINLSFQLITGEEFKSQIIDEVLNLGNEVADTSELFLRSWQLIQPFINLANKIDINDDCAQEVDSDLTVRGANRRPMHIAALYMSRFGHHELNQGNQTQTFTYLGQVYGVAANTVKNIRDRFDRYVDNHRVGWDAPLPDNLQDVLGEFGEMSGPELRQVILI